jgi:glucokinase
MNYAIGLDIGGTNVKAVAISESGDVLADRDLPTQDDAQGSWKHDARRLVEEMQLQRGAAAWVGVCCPGIAAGDGRSIWWMLGKMEATMGFEWTPFLGRSQTVPVYNDAQAALLGEICRGAARGARHAVLLTLGTGVGGAILCDGRLLRGHLGRAGHLGHVCVDFDGPRDLARTPGAIEYHIGNYSLPERSNGRWNSTRQLVEAFAAGDAFAASVWLRSVKALAAHIASVINAVDPELVILGGGIAQAGEHLYRPLGSFLDEYEWRPHGRQVRIVPAALGADAGAVGAAYGAMKGG